MDNVRLGMFCGWPKQGSTMSCVDGGGQHIAGRRSGGETLWIQSGGGEE